MKIGYDLTIEQSQKLVMTPELIQAIQILQFNTQELEDYIQEQVLINPVIEIDNSQGQNEGRDSENNDNGEFEQEFSSKKEEFDAEDWAEHIREREYDDISYRQGEYGRDEQEYTFEQFATTDTTLYEHLESQLQFISLDAECEKIAKYIIESLDENGYMTLAVEEICMEFSADEETVRKVLDIIQNFEPVGVGAENLAECLMLQLSAKGEYSEIVEDIVYNHLEDIAANRLSVIAKLKGISVQEVQNIADMIKTLEPKPGRQFASQGSTRYIIPDVVVEKINDEYVVTVNENSTPRLMVSSYYEKVLNESDNDPALSKFLSGRMSSALWLIKSIEQRKQTIFNVVSAVVKYQKDFFDLGSKHLKTLTLKQIADELGVHESTVSRSINGKYMQSPKGVYEIKYFFSSGVSGIQGDGISSQSIKTMIKEIVDSEDSKNPYSDQDIATLLKEREIDISRRTVAKYRDELKILSSSKRKRF